MTATQAILAALPLIVVKFANKLSHFVLNEVIPLIEFIKASLTLYQVDVLPVGMPNVYVQVISILQTFKSPNISILFCAFTINVDPPV